MSEIPVKLTDDQEKVIAEHARNRNISTGELVNEIVCESVEQYIRHTKLIQEGLEASKNGDLLEDDEVKGRINKILNNYEG